MSTDKDEATGSGRDGGSSNSDDAVWTEKGRRKKTPKPAKETTAATKAEEARKSDVSDKADRPKRSADGEVVRSRPSDNDAVRKVARAAETAGQRDLPLMSRLGYPTLVGLVCILGIALVVFARLNRENEVSPSLADHWHAAYAVYDCTQDDFLPGFSSDFDPDGIHSHQDGIIHIHPFFERATGDGANVGTFLNAMRAEIVDDGLQLDTGAFLSNGSTCTDGSEAQLHIRHWEFAFQTETQSPNIITENLNDVSFENDREVFIFAFASVDSELPPFPSARLDQLDAVTGDRVTSAGPTDETGEPVINFEVTDTDAETDG